MRPLLLCLAIAAAACDNRVGADPALRYRIDRLRLDKAEADADDAAQRSSRFPCAAILSTVSSYTKKDWDGLPPGTRGEMTKAREGCRAGAVAHSKRQIARLEAARRTHAELVDACFELDHGIETILEANATDPDAVPLQNRRKQLCP